MLPSRRYDFGYRNNLNRRLFVRGSLGARRHTPSNYASNKSNAGRP